MDIILYISLNTPTLLNSAQGLAKQSTSQVDYDPWSGPTFLGLCINDVIKLSGPTPPQKDINVIRCLKPSLENSSMSGTLQGPRQF